MFSLGFTAGQDASRSVAEGGAEYFVNNSQIAEASSFFLPLLDCFLNPSLTAVLLVSRALIRPIVVSD